MVILLCHQILAASAGNPRDLSNDSRVLVSLSLGLFPAHLVNVPFTFLRVPTWFRTTTVLAAIVAPSVELVAGIVLAFVTALVLPLFLYMKGICPCGCPCRLPSLSSLSPGRLPSAVVFDRQGNASPADSRRTR